ncbi:MAG: DUF3592 domain-containing protein [Gammaproteobacteria bacterium]|nr:DUF3592 domain-containing protein [Gammaproteobacteria bacterium]MBL6999594.1 DUF3592 domain-containing protein [Gammaproteobacteria bacterium]
MDTANFIASVLLVCGIVLSLISVRIFIKNSARFKSFKKTRGTVLKMINAGSGVFVSDSSDDNLSFRQEQNMFSGNAFAPLIEFVDSSGAKHQLRGIASTPPAYKVGQQVTVMYAEGDPEQAVVNSFVEKWLLISVLGGLALILLLSGALVFLLAG